MTDATTQALELPPLPKQHEELRARWKCDSCDGSGYTCEMRDMGHFQPPEPCKCIDCDGNGYVPVEAFTADQMREYALAAIEAAISQKENG